MGAITMRFDSCNAPMEKGEKSWLMVVMGRWAMGDGR